MAAHNELGKNGEKAAIEYLQRKGYTIIEHSWRHKKFEIDIIAKNEEYIIFIEVKTRKSEYWENPEEAISHKKIKRIVETADYYLKENNITLPARFDVIAIINKNDSFEINHIDDAFLAPLE